MSRNLPIAPGAPAFYLVSCLTVLGTQAAGYGPGAGDDPLLARGEQDGTVKVVHVLAGTAQKRSEVLDMGLDTTEHADATGVDVILHGEEDAALLRGRLQVGLRDPRPGEAGRRQRCGRREVRRQSGVLPAA